MLTWEAVDSLPLGTNILKLDAFQGEHTLGKQVTELNTGGPA